MLTWAIGLNISVGKSITSTKLVEWENHEKYWTEMREKKAIQSSTKHNEEKKATVEVI